MTMKITREKKVPHTKCQANMKLLLRAWASFQGGEHSTWMVRNEQNVLMFGITS